MTSSRLFLVAISALLLPTFCNAALINYGTLDGGGSVMFVDATADDEDYSPLTATGDKMNINPIDFEALSLAGGSQSFSSTISTTIMADPGLAIDEISLVEFGDYTIFGDGMVTDTLEWTIVAINGNATSISGSSSFSTNAAGTSTWANGFHIDQGVFGNNANNITVEWSDTVMAESVGLLDVAFLKKKSTNGLCVTTTAIPEPGSMVLLAMGMLAFARRRK